MSREYQKIHPYDRSFPWTRLSGLRQTVKNCAILLERQDELRAMFESSLPSSREVNPQRLVAPAHLILDHGFWNDTAVLHACLAIEGFLNDYGVRRFGHTFYTTNFERLPPAKKLSALIVACTGVMLPSDARILTTVRFLFGARNRLVHPKTVVRGEFTDPGRYLDPSPPAAETVRHMEQFFTDFEALDPDSRATRFE